MTLPTNQPPEEAASQGGPDQQVYGPLDAAPMPATPARPTYPGPGVQMTPGVPTSGAPFHGPETAPMQRSGGGGPAYPGPVGPVQTIPVPGSSETKRGRAVMVLTALLLVLVLGMTGLFVAYKINTDNTIRAHEKRTEKLHRDLNAKTDELGTTKDNLAEAENDLDAAYECMDAAQDLLNAIDEATARKALRKMLKEC
jgi:hypothetical protein